MPTGPSYTGNPTEALTTLRSKFPTPLGARHAEFLITAAKVIGHGAGLLAKTGGTVVTLPNGKTVSQDYIIFPDGYATDFLLNGEGDATVSWGTLTLGDPSRYVDVSGLIDGPVVPPIPPEPVPGISMKDVSAAISAALAPIEEKLNTFTNMKDAIESLRVQVQSLSKPRPKQVVDVETSRKLGHSHKVTFVV